MYNPSVSCLCGYPPAVCLDPSPQSQHHPPPEIVQVRWMFNWRFLFSWDALGKSKANLKAKYCVLIKGPNQDSICRGFNNLQLIRVWNKHCTLQIYRSQIPAYSWSSYRGHCFSHQCISSSLQILAYSRHSINTDQWLIYLLVLTKTLCLAKLESGFGIFS